MIFSSQMTDLSAQVQVLLSQPKALLLRLVIFVRGL